MLPTGSSDPLPANAIINITWTEVADQFVPDVGDYQILLLPIPQKKAEELSQYGNSSCNESGANCKKNGLLTTI